jgi:hypothetical protein
LTLLCDGAELWTDCRLNPLDVAGGTDETPRGMWRHQCADGCRHAEDSHDARMRGE